MINLKQFSEVVLLFGLVILNYEAHDHLVLIIYVKSGTTFVKWMDTAV
jgi:hypothetical protein